MSTRIPGLHSESRDLEMTSRDICRNLSTSHRIWRRGRGIPGFRRESLDRAQSPGTSERRLGTLAGVSQSKPASGDRTATSRDPGQKPPIEVRMRGHRHAVARGETKRGTRQARPPETREMRWAQKVVVGFEGLAWGAGADSSGFSLRGRPRNG